MADTPVIPGDDELALLRNQAAIEQARAAGLLTGPRTAKITARFNPSLLNKARKRAHVQSDTELLELALVRLALEDDFGRNILKRKGRISESVELEF
jgi:hypothetical protein